MSGTGRHILFLDDEEPIVYLATRMISLLGYKVSGFTRGTEALAAFRADPGQFDLVIVDHNMPEASGLEIAAEFLLVRAEDLPIVLCSGYVNDELKQSARAVGIREVLDKPNSVAEFGAILRRVLDTPSPA